MDRHDEQAREIIEHAKSCTQQASIRKIRDLLRDERVKALEEADQACERVRDRIGDEPWCPTVACDRCQDEIRALKEPSDG